MIKVILMFGLMLASLNVYSETVFGPSQFFSVNGNLSAVTKIINLAPGSAGLFLLKIQNGKNGPALYAQCADLKTEELKRQCQYDNLTERYDREFMRAEKLLVTVNGKKLSPKSLINKASSYLEFPIILNQLANTIIIETQGYPTSVVTMEIVSIENLNLSPKALFTVNALSGNAPFKLTYNASESFDPLNNNLTYDFDFGVAGANKNTKTGSYTYTNPGTYTITLKTQNAEHLNDTLTAKIVVLPTVVTTPKSNKSPIAKIITSYPDPLNLRKLQVTSIGSFDPDGVITKTEIDFGDGFKQLGSDITHLFSKDGTYLITLKVWDNQNATASIQKSVTILGSNEFTTANAILGPKKYFGSFSSQTTENESISRSLEQAQNLYKLTIKNADGLEHNQIDCNQKSLPEKIMCKYANLQNWFYIQFFRVDWANVYLNGKRITDNNSIKKTIAQYETYITLKQLNTFQIKFKGWPTAYIDLSLNELATQTDKTPPALVSSILSDSVTNKSVVHISIQDNSNVETAIYKNNILDSTVNVKEFDISLNKGINNIVLKSKDQFGNLANDFVLNNITFDDVPPIITSDAKLKYYTNSLNQNIFIKFESNKALNSLLINGSFAVMVDATHFTYLLNTSSAGDKSFSIVATDLAGNVTNQNVSTSLILDSIPPVLAINVPMYTKQNEIKVDFQVTDESDVVNEIRVNGILINTSSDKIFSYTVPLTSDGAKMLELKSTDSAGNVATQTKQIIKDTSQLNVQIVSPQSSAIYSSQVVEVRLASNKDLKNVWVNNVPVQLGTNLKAVLYYTQVLSDGPFTVTIKAEDQFGDSVTSSVQSELKLNSTPSWTYQECTAE